MLPWDFGIINAIKKEINFAIYPSSPPDGKYKYKTPYIVFELKNIHQCKGVLSRAEFILTIVEDENCVGIHLKILKIISKIISKELTLGQEKIAIGSARIKINSVEYKKNNLILNLVAMLQLKAVYEDETGDGNDADNNSENSLGDTTL